MLVVLCALLLDLEDTLLKLHGEGGERGERGERGGGGGGGDQGRGPRERTKTRARHSMPVVPILTNTGVLLSSPANALVGLV